MRPVRSVASLLRGRITLLSWVIGACLTLLLVTAPDLGLFTHQPMGRAVLNTVDVCVALLAAWLALGRFVRGRVVDDLLLTQCLLVLALANVLDGVLRQFAEDSDRIWLTSTLRVLGAALLLAAALVPPDRHLPTDARRWALLGPLLVLAAGCAAAVLLSPLVPLAMDIFEPTIGDVRPPLLEAHPVIITGHLIAATCFLVASVVFTVRGRREGDALLRWVGAACGLGGFARINYALLPSGFGDFFYTGDLLRSGFYVLLLVGSARELSLYWTRRELEAVEEDRRRLARDLHDGVVQELSYIRGEAHAIPDPQLRERVVAASDRALDESRAAIHALGQLGDEPLADLLERTARDLGRRHGLEVQVEADEAVTVEPEHHHAVLRIVREAVTNAVRHGRASAVLVELRRDGPARLVRVSDNGSGFDPTAAPRTGAGYGMISMAERARTLPGTLEVESEDGRGCEVRLRW